MGDELASVEAEDSYCHQLISGVTNRVLGRCAAHKDLSWGGLGIKAYPVCHILDSVISGDSALEPPCARGSNLVSLATGMKSQPSP